MFFVSEQENIWQFKKIVEKKKFAAQDSERSFLKKSIFIFFLNRSRRFKGYVRKYDLVFYVFSYLDFESRYRFINIEEKWEIAKLTFGYDFFKGR